MNRPMVHVAADAEVRSRLAQVLPERAEMESDEADTVFARIVWSRLVEPGDAVAGALVANLGPGTAIDLLVSGADARRFCAAINEVSGDEVDGRRIAAGLARWRPRLDRAASLADLDRAAAHALRIVDPASPLWPSPLDDLGLHAPLLLWVCGNPVHLAAPALAVVGARACTGYGAQVTAELTDAACTAGATIVSGAAYGIDAVAHRTALASGTPTVAVVAGGGDRPYPRAHTELLGRIAEAGAVCSEMVPGSAPTRWRFLMRNRVIAALATGVLVTEAGARSGSLNTAGNASEIGRTLGAVPGPITSAASTGCHRLIREYDAMLVSTEADVRELLGCPSDDAGTAANPDTAINSELQIPGGERSTPHHRRMLDALPLRGGRTSDEAARQAGLAPADARAALAELELLGQVSRHETPEGGETMWRLHR